MKSLFRPEFRLPLTVLALLVLGALTPYASVLWAAATILGIIKIARDTWSKVREGSYSLDYIAFLAMIVSLVADQYLAGGVVALMITGGEALDEFASKRAESALRALVDRIPKHCTVRSQDGSTRDVPIQDVESGAVIVVRPNELIPLDGTLVSKVALLNEANLTGEAIPIQIPSGAFIKSGSVNVGELLELTVEGGFESSTYMRIVHLVEEAKHNQAPVVKLAERVNFPFTAVALALSGGAYALTGDLGRALSVLVIATPCPLIIAAPVAFIGGLSRAARRNIIIKRPSALEELSRAKMVFFDKTGTLTLGEPLLTTLSVFSPAYDEAHILSIAAAIEFHSIHPLSRAILTAAAERNAPMLEAVDVAETIGKGISGSVEGIRYTIQKSPTHADGIALSLLQGETEIARLIMEDKMKDNVSELIQWLHSRGIATKILTGDSEHNAQRLFGSLGMPIVANCTPESKYEEIDRAKKKGLTVAMVGDGLNDAPALAHAHVGIVFSGTENSASIDAAAVVILGRDVQLIRELMETSVRSMRIAGQSIWGGVTLSTVGMLFAAFGFIPPVTGALIQEVIDVAVILNSLRAARS
jgi:heavy metal translocating P-type ATPase